MLKFLIIYILFYIFMITLSSLIAITDIANNAAHKFLNLLMEENNEQKP